jgi:hypothetical protein
MVVIHDQPDTIQAVAIMFALMLLWTRGFAMDLGAADSVISFFTQPWALIAYFLIMFRADFFFKWFPGSVIYFTAGIVLFLVLKAGGT